MRSVRKVAFVGQPEYFQVCYENDLDDLYQVGSFPLRFNPALDMEADVSTMSDLIAFNPDITVFFRGEYINNSLISGLRGIKIGYSTEPFPKLINKRFHYTRDSVNRFKFFLRFSERKFDATFHYDDTSRCRSRRKPGDRRRRRCRRSWISCFSAGPPRTASSFSPR